VPAFVLKAYNMLYRKCTMSLLEAYGIGPHTHLIIDAIWEWELVVPKSGGCFSNPFRAHRGVHVISPIIFNIVVDSFLREWDIQAIHLSGLSLAFYADDGRIEGDNDSNVQEALNIINILFLRIGLQINSTKPRQ
jgi:hypothetical protein